MSGGVTYDDSNANGSEYVYPPGQRQAGYAQVGLSQAGGMMPGMGQPGMQLAGNIYGMGEPSMRESVEGIPQVHMQQHAQLSTGVPGGQQMQSMMAQQMAAGVMPQYAMTANVQGQAYAGGVPVQYYQVAHPGFPPQMATHVADYRFGATPQFMHGGEWEDEYDDSGGAVLYSDLEVKHRRRTTPEQLRVLEHWFAINPRPDNAMREWLASELGITKRNVQVWFQNRRAKIKQQEKAREAAAAESKKEQLKNGTSEADGNLDGSDANKSPPTSTASGTNATPSAHGTPVPSSASAPITPNAQHKQPPPMPSLAVSTDQVPSRPSSSAGQGPPTGLLPTTKLDMGRRVSIAGGDMAMLEQYAIQKRRQQMGQASPYATLTAANSPMGAAAAARRSSQPYPTGLAGHHVGGLEDPNAALARSALGSPKVSPSAGNGRMPGALLFTAMRNNTIRRASMPGGGAQLISTTAFTPPRVSTYHNAPSESPSAHGSRHGRELSPIKDQDYEIDPALRGQVPMTFVTPPQNGFSSAQGHLALPGTAESSLTYTLNPGMPFTPNSPLPNPSFSFGGTPADTTAQMPNVGVWGDKSGMAQPDTQQDLFMALQRGRLGSIASVNSVATNGTEGTATEYGSDVEWGSMMPPGFDPDIRRASAPADLLHNIGLLGISGPASQNPSPIRPSPLAAGYQQQAPGYNQAYELSVPSGPVPGPNSAPHTSSTPSLAGGPYLPASNTSPTQSTSAGSALPSEGPSPAGAHSQIHVQSLMPPPPLPGQQQQQQQYQLPDMGQQYSESSANLPSSFPSVPDPSAYTNPSGLPYGEFNTSGEFDLSFEFTTDSEDKDQFSFLSDLSADNSDTVNVLV